MLLWYLTYRKERISDFNSWREMTKVKNVQSIICLVFLPLFANQACAVDLMFLVSYPTGDIYKVALKKVRVDMMDFMSHQNIELVKIYAYCLLIQIFILSA